MFTAELFASTKRWKLPKCLSKKIDKLWLTDKMPNGQAVKMGELELWCQWLALGKILNELPEDETYAIYAIKNSYL